MNPKSRLLIPAAALAAALALAGAQPAVAQIQADALALPSGYTQGFATAVNAAGQIAGVLSNGTGQVGCVWTSGTPTVLPDLTVDGTVWNDAQPTAINDSGMVVGYTVLSTSWYRRATGWVPNTDGSYTAIDLAPDGNEQTEAYAINGQAQVLCRYDQVWYLWEDGVATPITTTLPDGTTGYVQAGSSSMLGLSALLASDGLVAGTVQVDPENYKVVLWRKTGSVVSVTDLTIGGMDSKAHAISPGGVVAGYSWQEGLFIYDSRTLVHTYLGMTPWMSGSLTYAPVGISSVNDQGQAVVIVSVTDSADPSFEAYVPWVWQSGTWTEIPMESLVIPGASAFIASGLINANGQVAGFAAENFWSDLRGFAWSTDADTQLLTHSSGTVSAALALNDSGLAVGLGGVASGSEMLWLPVTWSLSEPSSALDIAVAEVSTPNPKSKTCTVTVTITNTNASTAYDVTVTSASLGGVATNSVLPLVYGAMKPATSKQVKLQFKAVPSGEQTLTIDGTSSLGDFFTTQVIEVP